MLFSKNTSTFLEKRYTYCFTTDKNEIQAYYELRRKRYMESNNYNLIEDKYDKHSRIVIAKLENKVVGGLRLIISFPDNYQKLSVEGDGFDLLSLIPDLSRYRYCELSRVCVSKEEKGSEISKNLFILCLAEATCLECKYIFASSIGPLINFYKKTAIEIGYKYEMTEQKIITKEGKPNVYLGLLINCNKNSVNTTLINKL